MPIRLDGLRRATRRAAAFAALAGTLFLAVCATSSADPLAAQWHLDEIVGATPETAGTTSDSSGHGLDASAIATTVDPAGRFGAAFSFNGESEVRVGGGPTLEPAAVTIVAWVKRSDTPGAFRYIVAKGGRGCGLSSYALYTGANGGLQFYVSDGASASLSPAADPGVWDGAWHAVAGTFDGQTVRLYVDGLQVGGGTAASAPLRYGLDSDALLIGQYPLQSQCALTTHYTGDIDEVRVYDRALSVTEVGRLQNAAGSTPPVLEPDPTTQPPPGPGPPPAPPGRVPPVLPPRVTGVASAAPIVAGRPALLTAQVQGDARRLQWDVTGDGKTDVTCDGDRTTLRFRAPAGTAAARAAQFGGKVSVRASGATGAGPAFSRSFAVVPAPRGSGSVRLNSRLGTLVANAPAVYACGRASDLSAAVGELTVKADTSEKYCLTRTVIAGTLSVEGCLKPIRRLEDIPPPERGVVLALARTLRYPVVPGEIKAFSQIALSFTDSYVAVGPVLVNGVELAPGGDARIVIFSQVNQILSSDATMSVGGIRLKNPGEFSLDTRAVADGTIPLGPFARLPSKVKGLGDFPLTGDVRVTLRPGSPGTPAGSLITTQLELPDWLTTNGERIRGQVTLRVTADGDLVLDDMHIGPIDAEIGPVGVSDFKLDYTRQTQEWKGQASVCIVIACIDAVERPGEAPPGGVVIRDGELQRAFLSYVPPVPGIALYPPFAFLTRIGAGLALNPTRLLGGAEVSVVGIFKIDGTLVLAFPSQATPFRLTREESGGGFPPAFYERTYSNFTLALGGEAFLKVPLIEGRVRLAGGFLLYEAPGYVAFGGDLDYDFFGLVQIQGRATGEMNFATGRFNLGADARACIADVICGGAITRVSSVGIGGCVTVSAFGESLSVGGGVNYSPFAFKFWPFDGCKWSRFEEPNVFGGRAVRAQAGGIRTVLIKAGDPSRAIRLDGAGGAPSVRVTEPGGKALVSSSGAGLAVTKSLRIMRSEQLKATIVGLVDPKPGTYTITPLPGSPTIAKLTEANDPPDARVKASVIGKGARRKLAYDVARRPEQRVTFVESGSAGTRQIGTVSGGRGSLSFSPAPGGGRRRIQAQFELAGVPAERLTVASFAPPSARLARPGRVAVRRRGAKLLVSWARVAGATRYGVTATLASGAQRATTTRRRSATLTGITTSSGGRVAVRGVASMRQGGLRTARFRATKPPARTRFGPLPRAPRR